jgi:hypothetical protein
MIAEATKYEKCMKAMGAGAFGRIEYDTRHSASRVVLRTAEMKTADLSGTVRIYFDNKREQVASGRRFDPMRSGLLLLRPGVFYRVYSTLEIVEPVPKGVTALVVLNSDAEDLMMVTTAPFYEGFSGPVNFTILAFRKVELEKMTSVASLMFFEDGDNSIRTKKSEESAASKKKPTTPKKKAVQKTAAKKKAKNASSVPNKRTDDTRD